jgi:hypothetical protein
VDALRSVLITEPVDALQLDKNLPFNDQVGEILAHILALVVDLK